MSVIAVEISEKYIDFVADTQSSSPNQSYTDNNKLVTVRNVIVGIVGASELLQFIEKYLQNSKEKIELNTQFDVITLLQKIELNQKDTNSLFPEDCEMLITDSTNTWLVQPYTLTVIKINKFEAIGSGANYAIGAYKSGVSLKKSVQIACESSVSCSEPLVELTVKIQ